MILNNIIENFLLLNKKGRETYIRELPLFTNLGDYEKLLLRTR
jgi:hypothetical protein